MLHQGKQLENQETEVEIPFAMSVKSIFSQIKLGLLWRILIQIWARIEIKKSDI